MQDKIKEKLPDAIPYQKCPKCDGQGIVSKPPCIAGDVHHWSASECSFTCNVCNGAKIIPMLSVNHKPTLTDAEIEAMAEEAYPLRTDMYKKSWDELRTAYKAGIIEKEGMDE